MEYFTSLINPASNFISVPKFHSFVESVLHSYLFPNSVQLYYGLPHSFELNVLQSFRCSLGAIFLILPFLSCWVGIQFVLLLFLLMQLPQLVMLAHFFFIFQDVYGKRVFHYFGNPPFPWCACLLTIRNWTIWTYRTIWNQELDNLRNYLK